MTFLYFLRHSRFPLPGHAVFETPANSTVSSNSDTFASGTSQRERSRSSEPISAGKTANLASIHCNNTANVRPYKSPSSVGSGDRIASTVVHGFGAMTDMRSGTRDDRDIRGQCGLVDRRKKKVQRVSQGRRSVGIGCRDGKRDGADGNDKREAAKTSHTTS